jgi:hypothetical protein
MSLTAIMAATVTAFEAVTGVHYVLDYEPKAVHDTPMVYLLLDDFDRDQAPDGIIQTDWRLLATLVLRWQDNEQAEQDLVSLVDSCAAALDADPTLGDILNGGYALLSGGDAGYIEASGTKYRIVSFTVEVTEIACT